MFEVLEDALYEFYGLILEINDSTYDTYSCIVKMKDDVKAVIRVNKNINILKGEIYYIKGIGHKFKTKVHIFSSEIKSLSELNLTKEEISNIKEELLSIEVIDVENSILYIEKTIDEISNENIKEITKRIYNKYKDKFITYPAATKFHHAYKNGLLYHTYSVLKLAKAYKELYVHLNEDLLYSGVILHDMMKVVEIDDEFKEYTKEGKLIGHISLASLEVLSTAKEIGIENKDEVNLLIHILLSHHEEGEYGSPKKPQIIEALIVHLCDISDARIAPTIDALKDTKIGEYSEPIYVNNKTRYLKHNLSK